MVSVEVWDGYDDIDPFWDDKVACSYCKEAYEKQKMY